MPCTADWSGVRLTSPGGIDHKVIDGLKFSGDENKVTATLVLMIQTSDWGAFLDELLPQPQLIGSFVSVAPRLYLINAPWLRVKSFTTDIVEPGKPIDPFGADPSAPDGTYGSLMSVTITFETMQETSDEEPDEGDPTTFLEHSVNAGVELLHIPPKKNDVSELDIGHFPVFDDVHVPPDAEANDDPELGIYKLIPTIEHTLKWKYALNPAWKDIFEILGHVNREKLRLFKDADPETVLFSGIAGQRNYRYFRRRTNASPWSLDFKFSQRVIHENGNIYGWNHVYSPSKSKWVRPVRKLLIGNVITRLPLYEHADLLDLFKAG